MSRSSSVSGLNGTPAERSGSVSGSTRSASVSGAPPTSEGNAYDLVQLLSISKNLEHMYDAEDLKYPVNDMFLVGYSVLANEPYSVFRDSHRDLMDHLHSYSVGSPLSDFKIGLVYTVLAVGALSVPSKGSNEDVATSFINKAWNILVDKLIPKHTSLIYQSEILKNLYVLTYTYLRFFNNDLMVPYLEDSSHIILQNLTASQNAMSHDIVSVNLDLFWSIYVLVSKYKTNESPPKFYSWFLLQNIAKENDVTLAQFMANYSKSIHAIKDPFLNEIVICTLSNEVNNLIFNKSLWIYDLRNSLHNAIILVNKSINKNAVQANTHSDIFSIFKKKLIINAPPKFKDLLEYYVFKIAMPHHWNMLLLSLREFNLSFNFHMFMKDNLMSTFQKFGNSLLVFFASNDLPIGNRPGPGVSSSEINNNLGIVSFPLIFNYSFLKLSHVAPSFDVQDLNVLDLSNLNNLILEWYITVVKILINLISNNSSADIEHIIANNYVLQCLVFMINDNDANFAIGSSEFYLLLFHELTKVCDVWLNFINLTSYMANFRANLNRFLNDLFVLALNNDNLLIGDLYVTNESILVRNRRSKSIGSLDMNRGSISISTPQLPKDNYVLMNKSPPGQQSAMSPGAPLPPMQGITKLQFQTPSTGSRAAPMFMSNPMATSNSNGLVLPPIYNSMKEPTQAFPSYM